MDACSRLAPLVARQRPHPGSLDSLPRRLVRMANEKAWPLQAAKVCGALVIAALVLLLQLHRVAPVAPARPVSVPSPALPPSGRTRSPTVAAAGELTCQAAVQGRPALRSAASCQA